MQIYRGSKINFRRHRRSFWKPERRPAAVRSLQVQTNHPRPHRLPQPAALLANKNRQRARADRIRLSRARISPMQWRSSCYLPSSSGSRLHWSTSASQQRLRSPIPAYNAIGRWILAAAPILGWVIGAQSEVMTVAGMTSHAVGEGGT
jgi:hypothetical protein